MLTPLGSAGRATGVHQEERCFGWHRHRWHAFAGEVLQHFIDKVITPCDHRRSRGIALTMTPPYQYLIDGLTFLGGRLQGGVGLFFMIEQCPIAVIAVHSDQDTATRVGDAFATRLPTEATKDDRVNGAQSSA